MDQVSVSPIIIMILIGLILVSVVAAFIIWSRSRTFKTDLKTFCPEAQIFIQARQKGLPVLALHDAGSSYTRFLLGETNHRASWTFKAEEFEVKFRPDFSSHCEPDRYYGDLEVYHAATIHPVFWGSKSIIAVNNIIDLLNKKETIEIQDNDGNMRKVKTEPFKKLRFLPTNDLLALMRCNAQDLEGNCQMFLKEYAKKDIGQPLPSSVNEFCTLIQLATKEYNSMPLEGDPDAPNNYYYDTIETIKEEKTVTEEVVEKAESAFSAIRRKIREKRGIVETTEPAVKELSADESDKPVYKLGVRHHWKLKGISYKAALMNVPITTFSQDVRAMEEMSREQGALEKDKEENRTFWKIIGVCAVLGVIVFGIIALINVLK